ncbi:MAG TPA: outer membrane beta-barrel protein [Gemmatimonadaceae bacterium]|nr:outer membrane beta-barrel protein [Gemmatimonadaceae bacterium]
MIARRWPAALCTGVFMVAVAFTARAQSAQPYSIQASFLAASQKIGDRLVSGPGFEGQLRYTPASLWSVGVGFQYSSHTSGGDEIRIMGGFIEPRYAFDIGSDRVAPYIAGRIALLRQVLTLDEQPLLEFSSGGTAFGGGAGMLIRLSPKVNIDLGAAFVSQGFRDASDGPVEIRFNRFSGYIAKAGFSLGFGTR